MLNTTTFIARELILRLSLLWDLKKVTLTLCMLALTINLLQASSPFQFLSPRPGSVMVNVEYNIIIREGNLIEPSSLQSNLFTLRGSISGLHEFQIVLAKDGKTILLNPHTPFAYNEVVSVTIKEGLMTKQGRGIAPYTFSFSTHREYTAEEKQRFEELRSVLLKEEIKKNVAERQPDEESDTRDITGMFEIITNTNPAPGHVFYDAFSAYFLPNDFTGYHAITSDGDSIHSKELGFADDFKLNKNGYFGVYNGDYGRWDLLDSNFSVIDKYYPANGYAPDNHEFQMLPNGHVLVIALEYQTVDMTVYDPDYSENATVMGTVIQEFDADKNLIFEWRSFDHVAIPEALHENLGYSFIDYVHTNSIEIDDDGHILSSHRHLDQVTKIDRNTGEFIWRLGGINNEFTFINEPNPFNYQHDARRINNGNITLFDNGNWHSPTISAAKEYQLDEVNMTATLVWSYSRPNTFGGYQFYFAMGNAQRLANGNTFINWGWRSNANQPSFTEVKPNGTIVWELKLASQKNMVAYRAHRYEWDPCARPTFKKMQTQNITDHSAKLKWAAVANAVSYKVQYKKHNDLTWTQKTVNAPLHTLKIYGLDPAIKYNWRLQTWCDANGNETSGFTDIRKFTTLAQREELTQNTFTSQESFGEIYPNPAHDQVNIQLNNPVTQIRLLNMLGQEVMKVYPGETELLVQLATQEMPVGNYLVEMINDYEKQVRKVVIE